jgi:hypothetical protein
LSSWAYLREQSITKKTFLFLKLRNYQKRLPAAVGRDWVPVDQSDNVISLGSCSKSRLLKLTWSYNNVIIWLLKSEIVRPKAIPLRGPTAFTILMSCYQVCPVNKLAYKFIISKGLKKKDKG